MMHKYFVYWGLRQRLQQKKHFSTFPGGRQVPPYPCLRALMYTITCSTFRNNHICFNFSISFDRNRTTFAATRHSLGSKYTKMHFGWIQRPGNVSDGCKYHFSPLGRGANGAAQIPQLDLKGHFKAGEREGKGKGKERKEWVERDRRKYPRK